MNDTIHHTQNLKGQMRELVDQLRAEVGEVTEPRARAMFETSAEVLTGLVKAFADYEKESEEAWGKPWTAGPPADPGSDAWRTDSPSIPDSEL